MATVTLYRRFNCRIPLLMYSEEFEGASREIFTELCKELPTLVLSVDHPLTAEVVTVTTGVTPSVEIAMPKDASAQDVDDFAAKIHDKIIVRSAGIEKRWIQKSKQSSHEQADSLPNTPIRK